MCIWHLNICNQYERCLILFTIVKCNNLAFQHLTHVIHGDGTCEFGPDLILLFQ